MSTDNDWEKWGATNPYYGVLSSDKFHIHKLDKAARENFFSSGEKHVESVIETVQQSLDTEFCPNTILDFGSGVGRLVIPFSRNANHVVGVDISPSMIAEAKKNCEAADARNISFVLSNDDLSQVTEEFDLIHSYIVLQHIPWKRGRVILHSLAKQVAPGGVLAVQFLTSCNAPWVIRALVRLRYLLPPLNWIRNIIRRRPIFEPAMQLHVYDLQEVLADLNALNITSLVQIERPSSNQFEFNGVFLYAHRSVD